MSRRGGVNTRKQLKIKEQVDPLDSADSLEDIKDTDFVDDIVKNMKNPHLLIPSVNKDEYKNIDEEGVSRE